MTQKLGSPGEARGWCAEARARGGRVGFVPTMGALHEGHLSLVKRAREECGCAVVSVFVNPLQFNDPKDLERYPRDFEGDVRLLASVGCDMVFTGTLEQFFPESGGDARRIVGSEPGPAARGLEGARRPGHFEGVATIVRRLFEVVEPARAYFGEKDFQQTLVVRDLARRMGRPEIVVCPTEREPDGVARSSRNALLEPAWRERAPAIHRALQAARGAWREHGVRDGAVLERTMRVVLAPHFPDIDYAEVRDPDAWTELMPTTPLARAQALIAVRAGSVRLIDNLRLD
jgi:pantoate--beta-alanine ligase